MSHSSETQEVSAEDSQAKKQSIASRLSEKLQTSLQSEAENDDDFQPDRKRIRAAEVKSRKKPRMDKGVIFLDDDRSLRTRLHPDPGTRLQIRAQRPAALLRPV
ncbi:hypothetical protein WMY93_024967 [Mugilogobius chulae]|uniref:Uncharacterized protein n=1 Tax=Mugilogobius chulae TaxID=88201 RepID=A0AAW0NC37_9GOBI